MTIKKKNLDSEPEKDEEKDEEKKKEQPKSTSSAEPKGGTASEQMSDLLGIKSDINGDEMIGNAFKGSLARRNEGLSDTQTQMPAAESKQSAAMSSIPTPRPGAGEKDDKDDKDSENTHRLS